MLQVEEARTARDCDPAGVLRRSLCPLSRLGLGRSCNLAAVTLSVHRHVHDLRLLPLLLADGPRVHLRRFPVDCKDSAAGACGIATRAVQKRIVHPRAGRTDPSGLPAHV